MKNVDVKSWTKGFNKCKKILKYYAYDIVLFTTNSYFSVIKALNIEQALTVQ